MTKEAFTIEEWLEPYLDVLGGRDEVMRLMDDEPATIMINAPLALMQNGMSAMLQLLYALHQRNMLLPPEATYHFEPRWSCGVGRSGYHNGSNCTPDEPHDPTWHCRYQYEMSLNADEASAAMLRAHGFTVGDPPKPKENTA